MRRTAVILGTAALLGVLATPGSASAALGDFFYTYTGADGVEHRQKLDDEGRNSLASRECHNVKEAEAEGTKPAHSPKNNTDEKVYLFKDIDCDGTYQVLGSGAEGGKNLEFRSFFFQDS